MQLIRKRLYIVRDTVSNAISFYEFGMDRFGLVVHTALGALCNKKNLQVHELTKDKEKKYIALETQNNSSASFTGASSMLKPITRQIYLIEREYNLTEFIACESNEELTQYIQSLSDKVLGIYIITRNGEFEKKELL